MFSKIATIQEITLEASELGILTILLNEENLSRDEALNIFEKWGEEFERKHEGFDWNGERSYYDEIDAFLVRKRADLTPYVDQYGAPYDPDGDSWPAGGGLHKKCEYNAEALFAYYSCRSSDRIFDFLAGREFVRVAKTNDSETWEKGNTLIYFESYDPNNQGGLYGYLHTELNS